jgi:hypothetical protein
MGDAARRLKVSKTNAAAHDIPTIALTAHAMAGSREKTCGKVRRF